MVTQKFLISKWKEGKDAWNAWIEENPGVNIDFSGVDFSKHCGDDGIISFEGFNFGNGSVSFKGSFLTAIHSNDGENQRICLKKITFEDSIYNGDNITFDGAHIYANDISFERMKFGHEDLVFGEMIISFGSPDNQTHFYGNQINFDFVHFQGKSLIFSSVFYGDRLSFSNSYFNAENISFFKSKFNVKVVLFQQAVFGVCGGLVESLNCYNNIIKKITFEESEFYSEGIYFTEVFFNSMLLSFVGACFGKSSVFFIDNKNGLILTNSFEVIFDGAKFQGGNVTYSCAFTGAKVSFKKTEFGSGDILFVNPKDAAAFQSLETIFDDAKFQGGNVTYSCTFTGTKVSFKDTEFGSGNIFFGTPERLTEFKSAETIFDDAKFQGGNVTYLCAFTGKKVSFKDTKFGRGDVSFVNPEDAAAFQSLETIFDDAKFQGGNVTYSCAFTGDTTSFVKTDFGTGNVLFSGSLESNKTIFDNARFHGEKSEFFIIQGRKEGKYVSFKKTKFHASETSFSCQHFNFRDIYFDEAHFHGDTASFSGVNFSSQTISFRGAEFHVRSVSFDRATIKGNDIFFSNIIFNGKNLSFQGCTFEGNSVEFSNSNFGNTEVSFDDVTFKVKKNISFENVKSGKGKVSFYQLDVDDGRFSVSVYPQTETSWMFEEASFKKSFDFECLTSESNHSLTAFSLKGASFSSRLHLIGNFDCIPDLRRSKISHHLDLSEVRVKLKRRGCWIEGKTARDTEDHVRLRRLKELAESAKDHASALSFSADENRAMRWIHRPLFQSILDALFSLTSNYGQSILCPFMFLIGSIAVFSTIFFLISSPQKVCPSSPYGAFSIASIRPTLPPDPIAKCTIPPTGLERFEESILLSASHTLPFLASTKDVIQDTSKTLFDEDTRSRASGLGLFEGVVNFLFLFLIGLGLRNRFRL